MELVYWFISNDIENNTSSPESISPIIGGTENTESDTTTEGNINSEINDAESWNNTNENIDSTESSQNESNENNLENNESDTIIE